MNPLLVINLKTYYEGMGRNGLKLGRICEALSQETGHHIILCPQFSDIRMFASLSIPIYSQHVDAISYGAHTGWILPEAIKDAGAEGTLLNHSEHQIDYNTLSLSVQRCREIGIKTIVCIDTPDKAIETARLSPDFIAIEPPELIGGNVSVSKSKPEVIVQTVENVKSIKNIPVLIGAGIKTKEDVKKGIELGANGVLVASGVVRSENPEKVIRNLLEGFNV